MYVSVYFQLPNIWTIPYRGGTLHGRNRPLYNKLARSVVILHVKFSWEILLLTVTAY
jgi:hypothetical protein